MEVTLDKNNGYQWGSPPADAVGEYHASIESYLGIPDTVRYYWNGQWWSEVYHTFWPKTHQEAARNKRSEWPNRYWKKV